MSRYRKGRRRAALLGITAGCVGAAVFLGVSVKLYRERKDTEAMIESRHAAWEQNTAGESSDPAPLLYKNKMLLECTESHRIHPLLQMPVTCSPRLYSLWLRMWHAVLLTGKKMHPVLP